MSPTADCCSSALVAASLWLAASLAAAQAAALAASQAAAASTRAASIGPRIDGTCFSDVISGRPVSASAWTVSPASRSHAGVYTRTSQSAAMKASKSNDLSYSVGLTIDKDAKITQVIWGSPAFAAGLTVGQTIVAVDGHTYSDDAVKERIIAAKGGSAPIMLTLKRGDEVRAVPLSWNGGLRYPRFTKVGSGRGALDILLEPK